MSKCRNSIADIEKFVATLIIMALHREILGYRNEPYYFKDGWVFVELFLIITGYYTAKHFATVKENNSFKTIFIYEIKKFLPLFPYTVLAVLIQWGYCGVYNLISKEWSFPRLIRYFVDRISFEMLLINNPSVNVPSIIPLWYLMTIIMIFPIACAVAGIKNRYIRIWISFLYCIIYYGCFGVLDIIELPNSMYRMLAGLLLGLLIYDITDLFKERLILPNHVIFCVIAIVCFALPIFLAGKGTESFNFILLCFIINLTIVLPERVFENVKIKLFSYLGRISMPMYIFHFVMGTIIRLAGVDLNNDVKLVMYYVVTFAFSAFVMNIVDRINPFHSFLNKLNSLED